MAEHSDRLDDLLHDPVIQLVMRSDGVRADDVRRLLEAARDRSPLRADVPEAHVIETCRQRLASCLNGG